MPQISKIRIVNFNYNDGNRFIPDELYDLASPDTGKALNTLFNLNNGGGKTVLVQLMMQPVHPKAMAGGRRIEDYFSHTGDHSYILLEWNLDGSKEKLLTGISIAASSSASTEEDKRGNSVKYYTFTTHYDTFSAYSISSLELSSKGCTIGTTMTITDKAVPNVVGVDIGCGMYTVNLGKVDIDFVKVDEAAHFIPSGMNVWEGRQERFDLTELACYRELKDTKRLERSLGTLGGGNHFIEIDEAGDGTKYLVIHSGSRNLGKQVAELYQKLAINLDRGYGDYLEKRDEIIRTYKEQGRRGY